ncbi:site-specific tyrosine recombinase XerC [Novipirellula galeiformis]|uniref:Site-specific tyrosine recombinase XerC n=1 Tax=Novipirellula galeiformis TaxID=2528004 RepID=A0A5C6CCJ8_9BACT|nr:site-specific integrase [Novipirellula galeiformis]TWU21755.1 site-specific tyrosine recombinase XerC [Novipirellula galeiformis]
MPKLTNAYPKYRKHSSGNARVTINRRDYLLGPHGTQASRRKYDQIIAEYLASGRSSCFGVAADEYTVAMMMVEYLAYSKVYYGNAAGSEWHKAKCAAKPLKKLYANLQASEFGPAQFKVVRDQMLVGGLSRTYVNSQMKRILRMVKWAAAEGKVSASVFDTLRLIPGLKKGRTTARETAPIMPVPIEDVDATLLHLPSVVADMVRFQLLAGCRPGEVCKLTPAMIGRSGETWVAELNEHKTAHHGHTRKIFIGPNAQKILTPYLFRDADDCLFRPLDTDRMQREIRTANRTTPPSCGNKVGTNRKRKPKQKPGTAYTTGTYGQAIKRAATTAGVNHWSPNQLRHARATYIRKHFGLEAAQVILGHQSADITQTYAERDEELAKSVVAKIG